MSCGPNVGLYLTICVAEVEEFLKSEGIVEITDTLKRMGVSKMEHLLDVLATDLEKDIPVVAARRFVRTVQKKLGMKSVVGV